MNIKKIIRFFADASDKGLPLLWISEGKFKGVILLIDTGSTDNIIFGPAYRELKDRFTKTDGFSSLYGINGTPTKVKHVTGDVSFCGKEYNMKFLLREDDEVYNALSNDMGFPVSGIIGTFFMAKYGWIIDFKNQLIMIPEESSIP